MTTLRDLPKPDGGKQKRKKLKLPPLQQNESKNISSDKVASMITMSTLANLNKLSKKRPHLSKYQKSSTASSKRFQYESSSSDHISPSMLSSNINFPEETGGIVQTAKNDMKQSEEKKLKMFKEGPTENKGKYMKASSKIAGTILDDIKLKKHLNMAFNADTDSFLSQVQLASEYGMLPDSQIPKDYWVYANSPLQQGFSQRHHQDLVQYDDTSKTWNKLIFPTNQPTRRVEIYLLARTLDDMLNDLKVSYEASTVKDTDDLQMEYISKSYAVHLTAMNELVRQIFTECAERGIMLHKIQGFFKEFYDLTMNVLQSERRKSADYQNLIREYEKLTNDLAVEKQQIRDEMDHLLKDKSHLFKERELLRRKIMSGPSNPPKYDLIIKLLKNTETRHKILDDLRQKLPRDQRDTKIELKKIATQMDEDDRKKRLFQEMEDGNLSPIGVDGSISHLSFSEQQKSASPKNRVQIDESKLIEEQERHGRQISQLHVALCETIELLKEIVKLNRYITGYNTSTFDHDEILYSKPSMNMLHRTLYHSNLSLRQIALHQTKAKEFLEKKNYIHVHFEYPLYNSDKTPYDGDFKVLLHTNQMHERHRSMTDMNDLYNTISKLRRENAKIDKENEKLQNRITDIEEHSDSRADGQMKLRQEMKDLKQSYEKHVEQITIQMLTQRNKLEDQQRELNNELTDEKQRTKSLIELIMRSRKENKVLELDNDSLKKEIEIIMNRSITKEEEKRFERRGPASPASPREIKNEDEETTKKRASLEDIMAENKNDTYVPALMLSDHAQPQEKVRNIVDHIHRHRVVIKRLYTKLKETQDKHSLTDAEMTSYTSDDQDLSAILKPFKDGTTGVDSFELFPTTTSKGKDELHASTVLRDDPLSKTELKKVKKQMDTGEREDKGVQTVQEDVEAVKEEILEIKEEQPRRKSVKIFLDEDQEQLVESSEAEQALADPSDGIHAKNRRLNGIIVTYQSKTIRAKSIIWLLKLITKLYMGKVTLNQDQPSNTISLPEYVFLYLKKFYGTNALVDEYSGAIMTSINRYESTDLRVALFSKFIREQWDARIFEPFLIMYDILENSAYGPEYALPRGDDEPILGFVSRPRAEHALNKWVEVYPEAQPQYETALSLLLEKMSTIQIKEYQEALKRGGYSKTFDSQNAWKLTLDEARQIITKAEFYECICRILLQ
mmetsp:Transcript_6100/g.8884  ORF Transcript_6100/g.8884 Transcript_6100/m.8884 type:complete len:1185 (+) Transcript_6100:143-3697(+)